MRARGSVRVWVRVLIHGSSWFGACFVRVLTNGSPRFGACLGACWVRVSREASREGRVWKWIGGRDS